VVLGGEGDWGSRNFLAPGRRIWWGCIASAFMSQHLASSITCRLLDSLPSTLSHSDLKPEKSPSQFSQGPDKQQPPPWNPWHAVSATCSCNLRFLKLHFAGCSAVAFRWAAGWGILRRRVSCGRRLPTCDLPWPFLPFFVGAHGCCLAVWCFAQPVWLG